MFDTHLLSTKVCDFVLLLGQKYNFTREEQKDLLSYVKISLAKKFFSGEDVVSFSVKYAHDKMYEEFRLEASDNHIWTELIHEVNKFVRNLDI